MKFEIDAFWKSLRRFQEASINLAYKAVYG